MSITRNEKGTRYAEWYVIKEILTRESEIGDISHRLEIISRQIIALRFLNQKHSLLGQDWFDNYANTFNGIVERLKLEGKTITSLESELEGLEKDLLARIAKNSDKPKNK